MPAIRDISERILTEEALRQSEALFKMLVEYSPVAIAVYASNTKKVEYVSKRFSEIFGYCQQDMPWIDDWWSLAYPIENYRKEIETVWNENVRTALQENREVEPMESVVTCKDGSTKYIETALSSIGDQNLLFFLDLTQRRVAEEALRQTHAFNDLLIQTMPFGMDIVDEEGNVLFMSKAMKSLIGTDATGKCCWQVYKDDKQQCNDCPLHEGISFGKLDVLETTGVLDGRIFQISHIGMMYEGKKAMLEVFQDITEQKKLQQELMQSQKMLSIGTLAGGIAHDFNNILGIILGYSAILQSIKDNPQRFSDGIDAIKQAVDRGAGLVRQILTFARKTEIVFKPMSIHDIVRELISMLQQTFPRVITFHTSYDKQLPYINADPSQIHQALLNLCVNARDAMPHGGEIYIKTETISGKKLKENFSTADRDWYACVSVSDTGTGMDELTRNRIFDPFFTTKDKGKGTGLGLSVVYGIIQAHHGFIDVESEVGKGTIFRIYLPVPQDSSQTLESIVKGEEKTPGGHETILLVEDEELLLNMMLLLLETHGYKVLTAKDGIEAIKVYVQHRDEIMLVVTDMGLPKLTGMDEFEKLKEINPQVKLIFASGYLEPEAKTELLNAGAKGFIQKPYVIEEVLLNIRKVLDEEI
jgi:PAS domain S-box-containing protein